MPSLDSLSEQLGAALLARGFLMATAESCTGGLVAAAITSIAGSSEWFDRGFVTYSNQAKHDIHSRAHVAVSITGIAGPSGGSATKPVGLVWHGLALQDKAGQARITSLMKHYAGDRAAVRAQAAQAALMQALKALK
jgi:nicotinamide-nucleotide amidase